MQYTPTGKLFVHYDFQSQKSDSKDFNLIIKYLRINKQHTQKHANKSVLLCNTTGGSAAIV